MCDYIGLDIGFIDHLNTQLVITFNWSTIANFHTLQITTEPAKSFPACCVFTSLSLVTASNNGYSSASVLRSCLNGGSLPPELFFEVKVTLRLTVSQFSQSALASAVSFSGPSPLGLVTIFYCLTFETSPFVASSDS
jgi:hypothetical protein